MHPLLQYPFDANLVLQKRRKIKKALLADDSNFLKKRIAILGGSTTHDIKDILELFLLDEGIMPEFYESDYGQYWQDAFFPNDVLVNFNPDIIFIHTSNRNITSFPFVQLTESEIEELLNAQYSHFTAMWDKLRDDYACPIIQNNFEMPFYRLLGNKDASDVHGRVNFISHLNLLFYKYAQQHEGFFINDINYLSANYGLEKWSNPNYWYMYKYALCVPAIPYFAFNLSNIIKSIFGKNKKAMDLDLDNTLWGGVIGDDGVDGIEIGHETALGEAYLEFQQYLKLHKDLGVMLNVNSKNDYENAIAGLDHAEGILRPDDFIIIKANWENKDQNLRATATELNILPESIVFIDDNPVERDMVTAQIQGVSAPHLDKVENYINILDKSGYYETTNLSADDINRNEMYKANIERNKLEQSFQDYDDYLRSLNMRATIGNFNNLYMQRISQLTNKTNQFNLTTKRYTQGELETMSSDADYICLYGKLEDKFGDNGVVTVLIGRRENKILHIDLWLMSCRVLKRKLEHAMLDVLVSSAREKSIEIIRGYYFKTPKNAMVKNFYGDMGFTKLGENGEDSSWELAVADYTNQNKILDIIDGKD